MPSMQDRSDTATLPAGQRVPAPAPLPLPVISEHQVILGTVAATAAHGVAPHRGRIASLWRRIAGSGKERRRYATRRESKFMMDARMAREMDRL